MKVSDILLLSTRMFTTRPMRTFLTILGVSVGIGTVLFLVSLGYGLQNVVLNKITTADALLSLDVSPGTSGAIVMDNSTLEKISGLPDVAETSPVVSLTSQFSIGDLTGDGLTYGVDPSFFRLSGTNPQYGSTLGDNDEYSAVISSAAAKLFNFDPDKIIGQKVSLTLLLPQNNQNNQAGEQEYKSVKRNQQYTIKGVVQDDNTSYIYIPRKTIADLNYDNYSDLKVKVKSDTVMENVRNEITGMGLLVSSLSDTIDQAKKIFSIIQIILALFGMVALIVSAIGMFNTMTITLMERINEIGIMRSIGASASDIRRMFLVESVLMGFLGGVGGITIGYLAGEIANFGINVLAKNFGGQTLNLFYRPPWFLGFIIIFSTVIGFVTGVYPSVKASRLNPLDALRYK